MSPKRRKKLNKIRNQLDKLDDSFIKLIKQRTELVKKVLSLKLGHCKEVIFHVSLIGQEMKVLLQEREI